MARKKRPEISSTAAAGDHSGTPEFTGAMAVALAILTFCAYWGVAPCGFVNLDDDAYIQFAPMVNQGLRGAAVVWAFTATHSNNWHPLTSLSHMLDCDLFGVRPGPMHMENVCWHALNAILVFLLWKKLTRSRWRSALVAALFALHPLHVESVAWVAERKDVLSGFFFLLSIWAYAAYVRKLEIRNSKSESISKSQIAKGSGVQSSEFRIQNSKFWNRGFYLLSLAFFVMGLLSKPMVVTLPAVLVLLDFWPLGRLRRMPGTSIRTLVLEKIPFFALGLIVGSVTLLVQFHTGAANYAARFPFTARVGNAAVSCARYFGKTFWPRSLSVLYHHPGFWPVSKVASATALLVAISGIAWWQRRERPWLAFGWLWFLITVLPVIGLVQVGAQAMADRYTYIPLLGIFTIIAWALPIERAAAGVSLASRASVKNPDGQSRALKGAFVMPSLGLFRISMCIALLFLGACFGLTRQQVQTWQDSESLYRHSIAAGEDNATVRYLLGSALQAAGAPESEGLAEYRRALELDPSYVNALTQLAVSALNHGNHDECRKLIERSIELEPQNPALHKNLGAFYVRTGHPEQALVQFAQALKQDPNYGYAHHEIAWIDLKQENVDAAVRELRAVVRASPWDVQSRYELGDALARSGHVDEARRQLERCLWIMPEYQGARQRLRELR